jgi:hypothetical protein
MTLVITLEDPSGDYSETPIGTADTRDNALNVIYGYIRHRDNMRAQGGSVPLRDEHEFIFYIHPLGHNAYTPREKGQDRPERVLVEVGEARK